MVSLLKTLASCHLTQMSRLSRTFSSPVAGAYRCLFALTTVPRTLVPSATRICSLQAPSAGSSAHLGPSLLGRCQRLPCIQQSAGMKTKSALKRRCKDCFFVRRRGRLFVYCKTNPRHKQRQG